MLCFGCVCVFDICELYCVCACVNYCVCLCLSLKLTDQVCAILNWKYEKYGDPLIDIASLLQVFLNLAGYSGYSVSVKSSLVCEGKSCKLYTPTKYSHAWSAWYAVT